MSELREIIKAERLAVPITLRFQGDIPTQGLMADEVAAVAEGMAKAVHFLSGKAADREREYTLHLTEVRSGSAIFEFLLECAAVAQTVLPGLPLNGFSIKQAGEVFSQAIQLLDFLKGKPPANQIIMNGDNNVILKNSEGATVTVNHYVVQVAGNAYFQEQAEKVMKPLKKPDRTLNIDQDDEKLLYAASNSYPAITARPLNDNDPRTVNTIEATLRVRQPHLDGENSWKFAWGRNQITAQVKDKDFMDKVRAGVEEFRSGDVLRVRLRIDEQQKGKNVTKRHYIEEVLTKGRET